MDWSDLERYGWMIGEFAVLGLIIWQIVSVRRLIRKDKEAERQARGGSTPPR